MLSPLAAKVQDDSAKTYAHSNTMQGASSLDVQSLIRNACILVSIGFVMIHFFQSTCNTM